VGLNRVTEGPVQALLDGGVGSRGRGGDISRSDISQRDISLDRTVTDRHEAALV